MTPANSAVAATGFTLGKSTNTMATAPSSNTARMIVASFSQFIRFIVDRSKMEIIGTGCNGRSPDLSRTQKKVGVGRTR
jgi:hypothetical protein